MNALGVLMIVTLNWVNPTQNTDGSALPPASITATRVEYGTCVGAAFGTKAGEWTQAGNPNTTQSPDLPAGTWCFRAYSKTAAAESLASNVAQKLVPLVPNPPGMLTVQQDLTAWSIVISLDRVAQIPVGTVAVGTVCDTTQRVGDRYVVPRSAVTFAGSVRPQVVLASCS